MAEDEHLPVHLIDRLLAEDLRQAEIQHAQEHLERCAACTARVDDARAAQEAFCARNPAAARIAQLQGERQRTRTPRRSWLRRPAAWAGAGALAAAAAAILLVVLGVPDSGPPRGHGLDPDPIRFKGGPALKLLLRRGAGPSHTLDAEDRLREGDLIEVQVSPAGRPRIELFVLGAAGHPTHLLSHQMEAPGLLPRTLSVDASAEPERLIVIFAKRALPKERVGEALQRAFVRNSTNLDNLRDLRLTCCPDAVVASVLLRKEKRVPTDGGPDVSRPTDP